ncbi:hypothetical protein H0N95_00960 [Candidatus Micrarchaeota archaeon]|nr:hypothetical protein [Candidatus Micrarchaeota archaeon]
MNHPLEAFELNNLTSARMDLVARCVNAALWLDHDIRRDVVVYFCFSNKIAIRIDGGVRNMNPDERNIASFFKHIQEGKSFPGISLHGVGFDDVMREFEKSKKYVLDIKGKSVDKAKFAKDAVFILGDDVGLMKDVDADKISLGPKSYLTSHCITVLNVRLDVLGL